MNNYLSKNTLLVILVIVCCVAIPLNGFSSKKKPSVNQFIELKALSDKITKRRFTSKVKITLFEEASSSKVLETTTMEVYSWDNYYHYKANNMEGFSNKDYQILINYSEKIILVNKNFPSKNNSNNKSVLPFLIDSSKNQIFKKSVVKNDGLTKTFEFKSQLPDSKIDRMLFKINSQEVKPISCEIDYSDNMNNLLNSKQKKFSKKNPKMLIEYTSFNYPLKIQYSDFDFSNIMTISKKNDITLSNNFKKFELVNYLKKK